MHSVNSYITTYTGKYINPLDIQLHDIDIEDIVIAGSNICRFGGHLPEIYSVNEHQILCHDISQLLYPTDEVVHFLSLTHDVCEIFSPIGDCLKPCKDYFRVNINGNFKSINEYEDCLQNIIIKSLCGKEFDYSDTKVKLIDRMALNTESFFLRGKKIDMSSTIFDSFTKRSIAETRSIYRLLLTHYLNKFMI